MEYSVASKCRICVMYSWSRSMNDATVTLKGSTMSQEARALAPCLGCVGNLGRDTFVGPGYWAVDTSIFKNFRLSDRFSLQVRAEAFNVFNRTNFQLADANKPLETANLNNPHFGQAGGTFNPRQLQFGLRLSF